MRRSDPSLRGSAGVFRPAVVVLSLVAALVTTPAFGIAQGVTPSRISVADLQRVLSISIDRATIPEALRAISLASGVRFIFRNESIPPRTVSIDSTPRSLGALLSIVLRGSGLTAHPAAPGQFFILPSTAADTALMTQPSAVVTAGIQRLPPVPVRGALSIDDTAGPDLSLRRSPAATQVITGDFLQRRGVRTLDELFHGDVPGVVAFDQGSDVNAVGTQALQVRGTVGFSALNTPLKTYVDGVEMADATFINHIDAKTIDHVELTLGPQASTMYGAGAISGVMQIYTKHGGDNGSWNPLWRAMLSTGVLSGRGHETALAPVHDDLVSVDGGTERGSYYGSAGYTFDGKHDGGGYSTATSRNVSALIGGHVHTDAIDGDASARLNNRHFGASNSQFYTLGIATGQLSYNPYRVVPYDRPGSVQQGSLSLGGIWRTTSWLQQMVNGGVDNQVTSIHAPATLATVADSLPALADGHGSRQTATWRITTDGHLPGTTVRLNTIAGIETWTYRYSSHYAGLIQANSSSLVNAGEQLDASFTTHAWSTGYFAQSTLGFHNALFLTAGAREGGTGDVTHGFHPMPRVGATYVRDFGRTTIKVRSSFGKAERPPCLGCRDGGTTPAGLILATPALRSEIQHGGDAGVDVSVGRHVSIQLTGYQQLSDHFLVETRVSAPEEEPVLFKYVNGGRVRNTGLETNTALRFGAITFNASYALANGRIIQVTTPLPGGLGVGDRPLLLAQNSGSFSATYSHPQYRVTSGFSYVGPYDTFSDAYLTGTAISRFDGTTDTTTQVVRAPSDLRLYANASYDLSTRCSLFLRGDNLNNTYGMSLSRNVAGRRITLGVTLTRTP